MNALTKGIVVTVAVVVVFYFFGSFMLTPFQRAMPSDPRMAGAAAGVQSVTQEALVGTWRSTVDPRFTRTFGADGSVTDAYEGVSEATVVGTYAVSANASLSISEGGSVFRYDILSVSPASLDIVYLDRGNILSFTRVP